MPSTTPPVAMTARGPKRSTSQPSGGPDTPCPSTSTENAPATTERLQPNSRRNATRNTEYAYQKPYVSPSVTNVATRTRDAPAGAVAAAAIVAVRSGHSPAGVADRDHDGL